MHFRGVMSRPWLRSINIFFSLNLPAVHLQPSSQFLPLDGDEFIPIFLTGRTAPADDLGSWFTIRRSFIIGIILAWNVFDYVYTHCICVRQSALTIHMRLQ